MKNVSFISGMILLFLILWGAGSLAEGSAGYSGFGKSADISPDDEEIVFVYEHEGESAIYTAPVSGGNAKRLAEPAEGNSIINPAFSPDGEKIAYVEQWEEDEQPLGKLVVMDRRNGNVAQMTDGDGLVTEAAFSPDGQSLFYLEAGVHTNYSPIATERPHDFDIYRANLDTEKTEQITHKDAYDMSELNMTPDGEALMYRSYDGRDELLFHSLEDGSEAAVTPIGEFAADAPMISSPALSPDGEHVVFSDVVATTNESGTFIYEGYRMDLETKQAEQITSFGEHVTSPVFFNNQDKLIVTVDKGFATAEPDYDYWVISADGKERERIQISFP
ncbi:TolB family protein [Virgibacillus natechei]